MGDFHATKMGQRFFDSTMPAIAKELARLNENLEALLAELKLRREPATNTPPAQHVNGTLNS